MDNLIECRLNIVLKKLELAKMLLDNCKYRDSIECSYYTLFMGASAILAYDKVDFSKHLGVIIYFQEEYIKTKKFNTKFLSYLQAISQIKDRCDCDKLFIPSKQDAEKHYCQAKEFYNEICSYIYYKISKKSNIENSWNFSEELYKIGEEYYYGTNGRIQNDIKAIENYEKAAKFGHIEAIYSLGWLYYWGRGVQQDVKKAFQYFINAAMQGHIFAQRYIGECYHNGWGVQSDEAKSYAWYLKAAEQGDAESAFWVALYYFNNNDKENAFWWHLRAARGGYAPSQIAVAGSYILGQGVEINYAKAKEWYAVFLDTHKKNGTELSELEITLERILLNSIHHYEEYQETKDKVYLTPVTGDFLALDDSGDCIHKGHYDVCRNCSRRKWNGSAYEDGPHCWKH